MKENTKKTFAITKFGFKFKVVVDEANNIVATYPIRFRSTHGWETITHSSDYRGIARCNTKSGDIFKAEYGLSLAMKRTISAYYSEKKGFAINAIRKLDGIKKESCRVLSQQMESIGTD